MKKLIIIRHAKSSWEDPSLDDFDRQLNKRGEKDAPRMGKLLREMKITPDNVISSPAVRAMETCKHISKKLDFSPNKVLIDQRLYHAEKELILQVVQEIPDRKNDHEEIALLFGHNPGLTEFVNAISNEAIVNIPTCGVVVISFSHARWCDAQFGSGKMEWFHYPKKVD
ncbi:MAG: histidine phosphatase family protein [Bacteroidetes bacterium]|nr:histidine phosphatase family protein [Bacteroidota bacterium]